MPRHSPLRFIASDPFPSPPSLLLLLPLKASNTRSKQSTEPATVIHSPTSNRNASSDRPAQKNNNNNPQPPKFLSSFLYKAIFFAIFIALLPLFPPQIPESTNPTFLSRTWELIHLLLVGIAVSYGVFSRRNADPPELDKDKEKDAAFKPDANSYVSRILQISPAFDEDDGKAETWSSQYHRAEPLTVESKPLLLPVRSLKKSGVDSMGSSSAVLSSPIPWRSRSGKMADDDSPSSGFYAKGGSFSSKEDSVAEKRFHPPPPPPPPPSFSHGSLLSTRREVRKSFKDELKDLSMKGREGFLKNSSLDSSPPRSVRTVRAKEAQSGERATALQQQQQQQKYQTEAEKKKKKRKKKVEFMEKMIVMSDESESDSSDVEEAVNSSAEVRAEAEENEVDKKADEFIAKFREQIRLQRIESIKKSSGHRAVKNTK